MYHINKLGGTAVGNSRYYANIRDIALMQLRPAFVVSAINPQDKNNGTTSQLINIHDNWHRYRQSGWSDMKNNIDPFRKLIDTHNELENNLGLTQDSRDLMKSDEIIESNVRKWRETLDNGFKLDDFVYLGELLSANIVSRYLNRHGVDSHVVDLTGIMKYHHIKISNSDERKLFIDDCRLRIPNYVDVSIPIFTGYFGCCNSYGTLGRGYSDTTSAIISSVYEAPLTVWKESGGVFTGHPFKVDAAVQLDSISLREANELTSFGNDVLHPMTAQFTKDFGFDVAIRDIRDLTDSGTRIVPHGDGTEERLVTAISVKENLTIVNVVLDSSKTFNDVLDLIRDFKPVLIGITGSSVSIAIDSKDAVSGIYDKLSSCGTVKVLENRACISCIGEGMKRQLGTSSKILTELARTGKNIEMIRQGPDEINVSVIVESRDLWACVESLHSELIVAA